ncbi:hypothetical protein D1872_333650 [compost metagenome]
MPDLVKVAEESHRNVDASGFYLLLDFLEELEFFLRRNIAEVLLHLDFVVDLVEVLLAKAYRLVPHL